MKPVIKPPHENKFALVTGASSGIGLAIAEELARLKINLVLVALEDTGLEEIGERLANNYSIEVYTFCVDLTNPDAPAGIYSACEQMSIPVNILVNNAGFGNLELFETSDLSELHNMMELNNRVLVSLTYLFIPRLQKTSPSYILNLGSLASFFKIPFKAVYSATKSFVYSFSAALRIELKDYNISVSCLCPGGTLTSERFRETLKKTSGANPMFVQMPGPVAKTAVRDLLKKRFRIVPGLHNQLLLWVASVIPEPLTDRIMASIFKPSIIKQQPELSDVKTDSVVTQV